MGEPLGVAPTLVEAYLGLGRSAEAAALAERYAAVTPQPPPAATVALVARCRALTVADDATAAEAFEVALAAHAQALDAFEAARTRLLYGARLRRAAPRAAAREQLRAALDAFVAMDLTAWAQRAADELAATGATARPRRLLASEPLTSQETRVALLVARGLSNREVAAALFLSPKTIEHHLASVFRKRGFRSRTELASTFAKAAQEKS
jgi:DNA-binding CsgD family transcriptional regulator